MYVDLEAYFTMLVESNNPKATDGRIIQHSYPDMRAFIDRTGLTRWCTASVNSQVNHMFVVEDAEGVWMMPYLEEKGVIVHSDPPLLKIGAPVSAGFGIEPRPQWQEIVEEYGFADGIKRGIKDYLLRHPPILW